MDLRLSIRGIASQVGQIISLDDWANWAQIPMRGDSSRVIDGRLLNRLFGIESKSWDPELFADRSALVRVAQKALDRAETTASEIDAFVILTATPYEVHFDADSFFFMRSLELSNAVTPLEISAGCGGWARTLSLLNQMNFRRALVLAYHVPSLLAGRQTLFELYKKNPLHPRAENLWMGPALFGDGAAAVVLTKETRSFGDITYSRDSIATTKHPAYTDPVLAFEAGGALVPPGCDEYLSRSCYTMSGEAGKRYNFEGLMMNHQDLLAANAEYVSQCRRIYTHQLNPGLVRDAAAKLGYPSEKIGINVTRLGNLSAVSTIEMLATDIENSNVKPGHLVAFSVAGAGPERGSTLLKM